MRRTCTLAVALTIAVGPLASASPLDPEVIGDLARHPRLSLELSYFIGDAITKDRSVFYTERNQLGLQVGVDFPLGRRWTIGPALEGAAGVQAISGSNSDDHRLVRILARARLLLSRHWRVRMGAGTSYGGCEACRSLRQDPRGFVRLGIGGYSLALDAEAQLIAYDGFESVRPLGNQWGLFLGLTYRWATPLAAPENHEDDEDPTKREPIAKASKARKTRFGALLGFTRTSLSGVEGDRDFHGSFTGLVAGAMIEHRVRRGLSLRGEVLLTQRSFWFNSALEDAFPNPNGDVQVSLSYVEVPILIQGNVRTRGFRIHGYVGPALNILVRAKEEQTYGNIRERTSAIDLPLVIGGGFSSLKTPSWTLDLRFDQGLLDVFDSTVGNKSFTTTLLTGLVL